MKKTLSLLGAVFVLSACSSSAPALKAGDAVIVDWAQDSYAWHNAKTVSECEGGWIVDFEDEFYDTQEGEEAKCYPLKDVIVDKPVKEADVKVGDKVFSEWSGAYYGATVVAIKDAKYSLKYDDEFEEDVELGKIRLRPQEEAAK